MLAPLVALLASLAALAGAQHCPGCSRLDGDAVSLLQTFVRYDSPSSIDGKTERIPRAPILASDVWASQNASASTPQAAHPVSRNVSKVTTPTPHASAASGKHAKHDSSAAKKTYVSRKARLLLFPLGFVFIFFALCFSAYQIFSHSHLAQVRRVQMQLVVYTSLLFATVGFNTSSWDQQVRDLVIVTLQGITLMIAFVGLPSSVAAFKAQCASADIGKKTRASKLGETADDEWGRKFIASEECENATEAHASFCRAWPVFAICLSLRVLDRALRLIATKTGGTWYLPTFGSIVSLSLLGLVLIMGWWVLIMNRRKIDLGIYQDPCIPHAVASSMLMLVLGLQDHICGDVRLHRDISRTDQLAFFEILFTTYVHAFLIEWFDRKIQALVVEEQESDGTSTSKSLGARFCEIVISLLQIIFMPRMCKLHIDEVDTPIPLFATQVAAKGCYINQEPTELVEVLCPMRRKRPWRTQWPGVLSDLFSTRIRSILLPGLVFSDFLYLLLWLQQKELKKESNQLVSMSMLLVGCFVSTLYVGVLALANNIYWSRNWVILPTIASVVGAVLNMKWMLESDDFDAHDFAGYLLKLATCGVCMCILLQPQDQDYFPSLLTDAASYAQWMLKPPKILKKSSKYSGQQRLQPLEASQEDGGGSAVLARVKFSKLKRIAGEKYTEMGKRLFGTAMRFPPLLVLSLVTTAPALIIFTYEAFGAMSSAFAYIHGTSALQTAIATPGDHHGHAAALLEALDEDGDGLLSLGEATFGRAIAADALLEVSQDALSQSELAEALLHARRRWASSVAWRSRKGAMTSATTYLQALDRNGDGLLELGEEFSSHDAIAGFRAGSDATISSQAWSLLSERLPDLWEKASSDCGNVEQVDMFARLDAPALACFLASARHDVVRAQAQLSRRSGSGKDTSGSSDLHGQAFAQASQEDSSDNEPPFLSKAWLTWFESMKWFTPEELDSAVHTVPDELIPVSIKDMQKTATKLLRWVLSWGTTLMRLRIMMYIALVISLLFASFILFKPFTAYVSNVEDMQRGNHRDRDISPVLKQRVDYATFFPGVYFSTVCMSYVMALVFSFLGLSLVTSNIFYEVLWHLRFFLIFFGSSFLLVWLVFRQILLDRLCVEDGIVTWPRFFAIMWCVLTLYNFAIGILGADRKSVV